jgi:hypothetical protein
MKYATCYKQLAKQTLYNKVRLLDYSAAGYLDGLEVVRTDYRELCRQYRGAAGALFIADPPYLSTDTSTYRSNKYWTLRDYLDVLTMLAGLKFVYFTSDKSQLVELCEWLRSNGGAMCNLFNGAAARAVKAHTGNVSAYTDIMLVQLNEGV